MKNIKKNILAFFANLFAILEYILRGFGFLKVWISNTLENFDTVVISACGGFGVLITLVALFWDKDFWWKTFLIVIGWLIVGLCATLSTAILEIASSFWDLFCLVTSTRWLIERLNEWHNSADFEFQYLELGRFDEDAAVASNYIPRQVAKIKRWFAENENALYIAVMLICTLLGLWLGVKIFGEDLVTEQGAFWWISLGSILMTAALGSLTGSVMLQTVEDTIYEI